MTYKFDIVTRFFWSFYEHLNRLYYIVILFVYSKEPITPLYSESWRASDSGRSLLSDSEECLVCR